MSKGKNMKSDNGSDDENENVEEERNTTTSATKASSKKKTNNNKLNFVERREHQRHQAVQKRRAKMMCHLCGQTGHVRRECPGLEDDGQGESKYKKANGDAGSQYLKMTTPTTTTTAAAGGGGGGGSSKKKKGARNRGRKPASDEPNLIVELPTGFGCNIATITTTTTFANGSKKEHGNNDQNESNEKQETIATAADITESPSPLKNPTLYYYDASCNLDDILDYIRNGRGKAK